jgi:hypothetical protein
MMMMMMMMIDFASIDRLRFARDAAAPGIALSSMLKFKLASNSWGHAAEFYVGARQTDNGAAAADSDVVGLILSCSAAFPVWHLPRC